MAQHELAGKPAPRSLLVNLPRLVTAFYTRHPQADIPEQKVSFGTSGHRGSSLKNSFNEAHVLATAQAVCDYRFAQGILGPLFLGKDTHALSEPSFVTAVEVLTANGVDVYIQENDGYTPTPVISHAVLTFNRDNKRPKADGIVITPSHNPPEDGGFKYNPPTGGPADTDVTTWIQDRANLYLKEDNRNVRRIPYEKALRSETLHRYDYTLPYIRDLATVIDMETIRTSGIRIGADPMGGSSVHYWQPIAETYGLNIDIVNPEVDPAFGFMTVDGDGKIRMDCSSPNAMARLIGLKDRYDIAFGNDPDADRHGIVTPTAGLMNSNHYLSVAIWYLFKHRTEWPKDAAIGKTLVSSGMIDRVASHLNRKLAEVPVGFKWFVKGLIEGTCGFGGEESAGASFLRKNGTAWTTDKDGIIANLLAAEITAVTGKDPQQHYNDLTEMLGKPAYQRIDAPAGPERKKVLKNLTAEQVPATTLGGEPIVTILTHAPANGAPIGGLKVVAENGWFAARPSGTEDIYKVYTESFKGPDHLKQIQQEALDIVNSAFVAAGV